MCSVNLWLYRRAATHRILGRCSTRIQSTLHFRMLKDPPEAQHRIPEDIDFVRWRLMTVSSPIKDRRFQEFFSHLLISSCTASITTSFFFHCVLQIGKTCFLMFVHGRLSVVSRDFCCWSFSCDSHVGLAFPATDDQIWQLPKCLLCPPGFLFIHIAHSSTHICFPASCNSVCQKGSVVCFAAPCSNLVVDSGILTEWGTHNGTVVGSCTRMMKLHSWSWALRDGTCRLESPRSTHDWDSDHKHSWPRVGKACNTENFVWWMLPVRTQVCPLHRHTKQRRSSKASKNIDQKPKTNKKDTI